MRCIVPIVVLLGIACCKPSEPSKADQGAAGSSKSSNPKSLKLIGSCTSWYHYTNEKPEDSGQAVCTEESAVTESVEKLQDIDDYLEQQRDAGRRSCGTGFSILKDVVKIKVGYKVARCSQKRVVFKCETNAGFAIQTMYWYDDPVNGPLELLKEGCKFKNGIAKEVVKQEEEALD